MITFAVDQSFSCSGIAVFDDKDLIANYEIVFGYEVKTEAVKLLKIQSIVNQIIGKLKSFTNTPNVFFICEGLSYGSFGKNKVDLSKLLGAIQIKVLDLIQFENIIEVPPRQWKKFLCGDGASDKKDVIKFVNEVYNKQFKLKDNNICDAIGIGHWFIHNFKR